MKCCLLLLCWHRAVYLSCHLLLFMHVRYREYFEKIGKLLNTIVLSNYVYIMRKKKKKKMMAVIILKHITLLSCIWGASIWMEMSYMSTMSSSYFICWPVISVNTESYFLYLSLADKTESSRLFTENRIANMATLSADNEVELFPCETCCDVRMWSFNSHYRSPTATFSQSPYFPPLYAHASVLTVRTTSQQNRITVDVPTWMSALLFPAADACDLTTCLTERIRWH